MSGAWCTDITSVCAHSAIPHENIIPNAHTSCGCGLPSLSSGEMVSSWGPLLLLASLSPPHRAVTHSSWCSFPGSPFLLLLHQGRVPARATHPPPPHLHPTIHLWGLWTMVYFTIVGTWQKYSTALVYLREAAHCQICVDRNITCTRDRSFISFFASSLLAGLDQGLEERGQLQAKSWPAPCPVCSGFTGLHRRLHGPLCLQDMVIFSIQHRWHPL